MTISSIRGGNAGWGKPTVDQKETGSADLGMLPGKRSDAGPIAPPSSKRPELPEWKVERNEWNDLHKTVPTSEWIAARASWKNTRDLSRSPADLGMPPVPQRDSWAS
jgi:hypothetical protein